MKLSHIAEAALKKLLNQQMSRPVSVVVIHTWRQSTPFAQMVPIHVLKELNSVIAPALCGIFRTPLQCGDTVPSDWKQA